MNRSRAGEQPCRFGAWDYRNMPMPAARSDVMIAPSPQGGECHEQRSALRGLGSPVGWVSIYNELMSGF